MSDPTDVTIYPGIISFVHIPLQWCHEDPHGWVLASIGKFLGIRAAAMEPREVPRMCWYGLRRSLPVAVAAMEPWKLPRV